MNKSPPHHQTGDIHPTMEISGCSPSLGTSDERKLSAFDLSIFSANGRVLKTFVVGGGEPDITYYSAPPGKKFNLVAGNTGVCGAST
eukprot:1736407-Ditylum_brightwellii.AAC.1